MNYKKILLSLVICGSLFAGARTVSAIDNSALIQLLLQQIAALQAQLTQLQAQQGTTVAWCHAFNTNMGIGTAISTSDLDALIMVLDKENIAEFIVINRPAEYNEIMAGGVVKLQAKYGILQTGYVGPITRTKLNALYGCGVTIVPTLPILPVVQPSVTVISPNGGESFTAGQSMNISWQNVGGAQSDVLKLTMVDYEGGNPAHIYNLATNLWGALPSNTQYYAYVIPSNIIPSSKLKIMVELLRNGSVVAMDVSNSYFNIVAPATATQPTIVSPQDNDIWEIGKRYTIKWSNGSSAANHCSIYMTQNGVSGSKYLGTSSNCNLDGGSYDYTVSSLVNSPGSWNLWVCGRYCPFDGGYGISKPVTIVQPTSFPPTPQLSLTVLSPNGGEVLNNNKIYNITWKSNNLPSDAKVQIQLVDETNPTTIQYMLANNTVLASAGSYSWTIPSTIQKPFDSFQSVLSGSKFRIFVTYSFSTSNDQARDLSDNYFNITAPTVQPSATIMSGMQANSLTPTIFGTANGTSQIGVVLGSAGGKAYGSGLISVANGNWSVTVSPAITVGQYTVYIYDANNNQLTSSSLTVSSPVSVQPTITVTSPNGGEQWIKGSIKNITWTGGQNPNGSYSGVDITLYSAYCQDQDINCITASTKIITLGALVSNSYTWQVGEASSGSSNNVIVPGNYKVKVCSGFTPVGQERVCDISNNYFSIVAPTVQPSVTLLTPNGGQTYKYGDQITLSWQITGTVSVSDKLYLTIRNYGGGAGDGTIPVLSAPFVNNNFSYLYTIPTTLPAGSYYKVSVSGVINGVAVSDNSDSYFSIISQ